MLNDISKIVKTKILELKNYKININIKLNNN